MPSYLLYAVGEFGFLDCVLLLLLTNQWWPTLSVWTHWPALHCRLTGWQLVSVLLPPYIFQLKGLMPPLLSLWTVWPFWACVCSLHECVFSNLCFLSISCYLIKGPSWDLLWVYGRPCFSFLWGGGQIKTPVEKYQHSHGSVISMYVWSVQCFRVTCDYACDFSLD